MVFVIPYWTKGLTGRFKFVSDCGETSRMPTNFDSNRGKVPPNSGRSDASSIPVLLNAFRVFKAVSQSTGGATMKSLAASLNIPPTTCYRILRSFVSENWLRVGNEGRFEISFGLVPLLRPLLRHELLIEIGRSPLADLAHKTGLTAKLSVRQGVDAVTIHGEYPSKEACIVTRVGSAASLTIGSSGAVFLAHLPDQEVARIISKAPLEVWRFQQQEDLLCRVRQTKRDGYCFDGGSYQPSINTLSAPLFGHDSELVGVLSLLGFPQDFSADVRPRLINELKFTAGGCSRLILGNALDPTA